MTKAAANCLNRARLWLLVMLLQSQGAPALDADSTFAQLNHRSFSIAQGAPAGDYALVQTSDGTLWIGGRSGLTRFDGLRFVSYPQSGDEPLPSQGIHALTASPDGALWIGFSFGGIAVLRNGHLSEIGERDGLPPGSVTSFASDRDGSLWVATTSGLSRIRAGRVQRIDPKMVSSAGTVLVDRAGNVWVSTASAVLVRPSGTAAFQEAWRFHGNSESIASGHGMAEAADGRVWVADEDALTLMDKPAAARRPNVTFRLPGAAGWALLVDHENTLWLSVRGRIARWTLHQQEDDARADSMVAHPELSEGDSANQGMVATIYQDREHDVWAVTTVGLDRFSHSNVVRAVAPCVGDGYALAPGESDGLWAACNEPGKEYLLEIKDGRVVAKRPTYAFTVAYRDSSGSVWFAGPSELGHLDGNEIRISPVPEQLRGFPMQALAREPGGAMWVSVVRNGVFRVVDGEWVAAGGLTGMPPGPAIVETVDSDGAIWFGYPANRVARVLGHGVRIFDGADGLDVGNVTAIHVDRNGVWVGGDRGLARLDGARFVAVQRDSGVPFSGVSGITGSGNGGLWVNAVGGIANVSSDQLAQVIRNPSYRIHCRLFDYTDGVPGAPVQIRPLPSAVADSNGRLWFATMGGLIWIDERQAQLNSLAPPVTIWSVTTGGERYANRGSTLVLPAHATQVRVEYTAGALLAPERVRFRYKLEGLDRSWQDAGDRHEATYTNLAPGTYRFRVSASSNDGLWNTDGASVDFEIPAAFYQTRWFLAICATLSLAVLIALYELRTRRLVARVRARLEERLLERERIARELHDTLLQGVQGLILRFQAVVGRLPSADRTREQLELSIRRANELLAESRERVMDLRDPRKAAVELSKALAAAGEHRSMAGETQFKVTVEGPLRALHPIVREEAFFIAREAMENAFRHSGAQHVEVEVSYDQAALRLRIRDDGRGFSPEALRHPDSTHHFGLTGMRERALKIRGHLDVWSKAGAGTEIELLVPAQVAYDQKPSRQSRAWWRTAKA